MKSLALLLLLLLSTVSADSFVGSFVLLPERDALSASSKRTLNALPQRSSAPEAKVEVIDKDNPATVPIDLQPSHLTIRNLATNKIIYERDEDIYFLSMYARPLNGMDALVINWDRGVCCNQLEVLAVDANQARDIFSEAYRADATLVDFSGDGERVDILVTTADGGAMHRYTTRYVWRNGRYQSVGRVSTEKLVNDLRREFKTQRR